MAMTDEAAKTIVRRMRDNKIAASEKISERITELTREYEDDQQEDTAAILHRQEQRYETAVEEAEALSILLGKA